MYKHCVNRQVRHLVSGANIFLTKKKIFLFFLTPDYRLKYCCLWVFRIGRMERLVEEDRIPGSGSFVARRLEGKFT